MTEFVPPASDAGDSYMGHYGLASPWAVWLLNRASWLLTVQPNQWGHRDRPPTCPQTMDRHPMVARVGVWKCYRHPETVVVPMVEKFDPAPDEDVLAHVGEALDWVWDDAAGKHVMKAIPLDKL